MKFLGNTPLVYRAIFSTIYIKSNIDMSGMTVSKMRIPTTSTYHFTFHIFGLVSSLYYLVKSKKINIFQPKELSKDFLLAPKHYM